MKTAIGKGWAIAAFAVIGSFFISGILAAFAADAVGLWHLPIAGFSAAFAVVAVAYWAAPERKLLVAVLALMLGALVAWPLLGTQHYPEHYSGGLAYQPTYLPLAATYLGGLLAYAIVALTSRLGGRHGT